MRNRGISTQEAPAKATRSLAVRAPALGVFEGAMTQDSGAAGAGGDH